MHFLLQWIREHLEMSLLQNSQQSVKRTGYGCYCWASRVSRLAWCSFIMVNILCTPQIVFNICSVYPALLMFVVEVEWCTGNHISALYLETMTIYSNNFGEFWARLIYFNQTLPIGNLRLTHTERQASHQASASSETSDLCNGSGTHLEHQVKHHHRLALVMLPLMLDVPLDAAFDARCGYTLRA